MDDNRVAYVLNVDVYTCDAGHNDIQYTVHCQLNGVSDNGRVTTGKLKPAVSTDGPS